MEGFEARRWEGGRREASSEDELMNRAAVFDVAVGTRRANLTGRQHGETTIFTSACWDMKSRVKWWMGWDDLNEQLYT